MGLVRELMATPGGYTRSTIRALTEHADAGDGEALLWLAVFAHEGLRAKDGTVLVRRDARRTRQYLTAAAAAGEPSAWTWLASDLTADPRTRPRGIALYKKAYRAGDLIAAFNLAVTYQALGRHRAAVAWFRREGSGSALVEIAKARYHGLGIRKDARRALADLETLAATERIDISPHDREQCFVFVARALLDGWTTPRDQRRATNCLRRAAALGSAEARAILDQCGRMSRRSTR